MSASINKEALVRELMQATRWNNLERVQELLKDPELDVNFPIDGRRAIADAIQANGDDMLKAYLSTGKVDLSLWVASFARLKDRQSKPFECFSLQCMKAQRKADVDTKISALMFAIECGDEKFKLLLDHGAKGDEVTKKSQESVLMRICSRGSSKMLKELAATNVKLDMTKENCYGKSALKALIGREKVPKACPFFYYDFCNEEPKLTINSDEYFESLKYIFMTTRKSVVMKDSITVLSWIADAIADEKCLMDEAIAERLLRLVHRRKRYFVSPEALLLVAQNGRVNLMKSLTEKGASSRASDSNGKTAFVYLLEKAGKFVEVCDDFGEEADFRSYLLTCTRKNIRIVIDWLAKKPELRRIFDEHYAQVGWEHLLDLFQCDSASEIVTCFDEFIFPLLQNQRFVEKLVELALKNPKVDFNSFINKLHAAKENAILRGMIYRADSLLQDAILSKNLSAASFIVNHWHVDATSSFKGKVPLYLAAEKSNCEVLAKLLAVAKPNSFDKAQLAHNLRHSPCNCVDACFESFDFGKLIGKSTAIDVYKKLGLADLVAKISLKLSGTAEEASQASAIDVVEEILSGRNKNWKLLRPHIRNQSSAFLDACFEQSENGTVPINWVRKKKKRMIKLFACLARYSRPDFFQRFVASFEGRFPGIFDKLIKRYGAYFLVSSKTFLMSHLLTSTYKIPVDARVHTAQGNYTFASRVLKKGFNSMNAVYLSNFEFDFSQLNCGNQSLRKSLKFSGPIREPNMALLKRFKDFTIYDFVPVLVAHYKNNGREKNSSKSPIFANVNLAAFDWTPVAEIALNLPPNLVSEVSLALLRAGVDPLIKYGQQTWLTRYLKTELTTPIVRLGPIVQIPFSSLKNTGLTSWQLLRLTDENGQPFCRVEKSCLAAFKEAGFNYIGLYIQSNVESYKDVAPDRVVGDKHSCMICRAAFEADEPVLLLPCNHLFHFECLLPLKTNGTWGRCPYCNNQSSWTI